MLHVLDGSSNHPATPIPSQLQQTSFLRWNGHPNLRYPVFFCNSSTHLSVVSKNTYHGQLILVPPRRERAIACGKAFLHLYIERKSFLNPEDSPFPVAACNKDICKLIWVHPSDQEISFICYLIFEVTLDTDSPAHLSQPNIPDAFLCWMSHLLLHRLNDTRYLSAWRERALDAIPRILVNPLPPKNVLANCFMAGCVVLRFEEYRQIATNRRVAEWGLEVCKTFVRTAGQNQDAQRAIWNDARTILHFTVIVVGDGFFDQSDGWQQGPSRLSLQEPTDCGWLIDYIIYYHNNSDYTAIADAMIALSQLPRIKLNPSLTPMMIEVLVFSLASERPLALRDAALRAANACRKIIFGYTHMEAHLFPDFSTALHSTLTQSDSPRQHLLYLQILYSCAKNEAWWAHILGHGHHANCLRIANTFPYRDADPQTSDHLTLYIIANLQLMQSLSDHPVDLPRPQFLSNARRKSLAFPGC
ncbi:hypothetical protein BDR07DRAFT_1611050 [Suillus spraguei]|nr:hypothetical protein BDR07DRAFT_1611050 [Suillus spraguei]